jgi:asparagine synthase (glutamine-hydrolysing)
MCGICGIVEFAARPVDRGALDQACAALRHRGPDHGGVWLAAADRAALGATRLKVLDPSAKADQPLHSRDGRFHLVYNGEIYNFRELRAELASFGDSFVTDGDTEVVLAACARWGVEAFFRFNGMWSLAFYDSQTGAGFLSRDRFGVKPLVYVADSASLRFASELRGLVQLGPWNRGLDSEALVQHLQFGYIAHPSTIYENARRLSPGHYLPFGPDAPGRPVRYYQPRPKPQTPSPEPYGDACLSLRQSLADAVAARRVSDVPIGAFLSGGLDSSIIVRELSTAIGQPVQTFSIGYAGHESHDETRYARLAAEAFRTQHHELVLTERDVIEAIPEILSHLAEPVGDSSIIPTSLLSRFARRFVTVALSGDGGDELFGGYWRYLAHSSYAAYCGIPAIVRRLMVEPVLSAMSASRASGLGNRARQFRKLIAARGAEPLSRHVVWSRILAPEAEDVLTDRSLPLACDSRAIEAARESTAGLNGDVLNRVLAFDLQYQLPADMLQKVDLASMMHSLEVRVPFLDYRVVESALAMPSNWKIDRGIGKRVLMDAYRGRLPDEILDRGKQGFEVPVGEFFRGSLLPMFHDIVTRRTVESVGLLSYPAVERLFQDHVARRADHTAVLWALLSLCWWLTRSRGGA